MGRLVVLVVLVAAAVWLLRRALARGRDAPPVAGSRAAGELVRCAHCGVHLPRGEARSAAGAAYCSEEHARLGPGER